MTHDSHHGQESTQQFQDPQANADFEQINATQRYVMYSVFRRTDLPTDADEASSLAAEALERVGAVSEDLTIRGWYDVSGLNADADVMVWWHAEEYETLQKAYNALRSSQLGQGLEPVWSQLGLHRPAEFNRRHVPAFMADEEAHDHICVYPFVRSYEWYLLSEHERSHLLREHGGLAAEFPDVRGNTTMGFALGDYEWLLCFEADDMTRIVEVMRQLRASAARRHVREETPFYTGRRRELAEIVSGWLG